MQRTTIRPIAATYLLEHQDSRETAHWSSINQAQRSLVRGAQAALMDRNLQTKHDRARSLPVFHVRLDRPPQIQLASRAHSLEHRVAAGAFNPRS
jgi:hypothetical protein